MIKILLAFFIFQSLAFASPRDDAKKILKKFKKEKNLITRLDKFSSSFIGVPYGVNGPLGEGSDGKYDQDPLYRFDAFDCTTYVETIMSLALSKNVADFEDNMDFIRYENGVVDYLKRNHFTDLQWIPLNIENGYLEEINEDVVPQEEILLAEALINFPAWLRSIRIEGIIAPEATLEERQSLLEELHQEAVNFAARPASVKYIAISNILARPEILNKIPSGAIVNFVRPNWDLTAAAGTHQNISHQGFLFRKADGVLYLRHAASSAKKVSELPFIDYLKPYANHATLKGIHLMKVSN